MVFNIFGKKEDDYIGEEWMSLYDRFYIPDYYGPEVDTSAGGAIEIMAERCDACGLCVRVCPSATLVLKPRLTPMHKGKRRITKVMAMSEEPQCVAVGDCAAICPNDACYVSRQMKMDKSIFKTINKGPLAMPRLFND